jgi:hypothetical protein
LLQCRDLHFSVANCCTAHIWLAACFVNKFC